MGSFQSTFIEFDKDDMYDLRNKITQNSYTNLLYDETDDKLFFLNFTTKELWEIDQSTGEFTKKTTCTIGGKGRRRHSQRAFQIFHHRRSIYRH